VQLQAIEHEGIFSFLDHEMSSGLSLIDHHSLLDHDNSMHLLSLFIQKFNGIPMKQVTAIS